jgi:serine/threonine protein kinase
MQKDNIKEHQNHIIKFATSHEKQILLQDELRTLCKIQQKNISGVVKIEHYVDSEKETFLVTKKVSGLFGHSTVRSLLFSTCTLHDLWFREILFQVIYTIKCLQDAFYGFRHNDLKCDNVLLHVCTGEHVCFYKEKKWKLTSGIQTVLIDFEVASSTEFSNRSLKSKMCPEYGLSSDRCDIFDIHLLFAELRMSAPFKSWGPSFLMFCNDFFDKDMFSPQMCTSQLRLTLESQKKCMTERFYDNFILRLLCHEYFGHLRT